jgi:hypothetical protein
MLASDQRFDAFGKQGGWAGGGGVVAGPGLGQVLLAAQPLPGRPIGDPVLLELIQLLDTLQDHRAAQPTSDPGRHPDPSHHRNQRSRDQLDDLDGPVPALVFPSSDVIPT